MRYREGQEFDPEHPYTENTTMMMDMAYIMSIPLGLALLWLAIKGKVMWLKVWSIGLIVLGISLLSFDFFPQ